jgi:hypothetical protein
MALSPLHDDCDSDHENDLAVVRAKRRITALEQELDTLKASNKRIKP